MILLVLPRYMSPKIWMEMSGVRATKATQPNACVMIAPGASTLHAPMASGRSLTKEQLAEIWDGRAELYDSPEEGFRALNREKEPEDMVYAAGSLYLAGQLLAGGKDD